jgi:hypothetical protein
MRKLATTAGLLAGAALLCFVAAEPVLAATAPKAGGGQALEIAPPLITLTADPGQTLKTQLNLRDISSTNLVVKNEINDFVAAGEDGTPKILTDPNDANPFSLRTWISPLPRLTMKPRQIRVLPITITVPKSASPGGHYGVIRFTGTPPELEGTGVSLSASLGALVLITVNGKTTEKLSIAELAPQQKGKTKSLFESTPLTFITRLRNEGNIHEQPIGRIIIKDMFGKTVAGLNVNLPPRNVLPDSIRRFESPLDSSVIGNKKLFGRYTADLTVTYGANKQIITKSVSFWVLPYRLIIGIIIALIAGFFILRHTIRRYNRAIISRSRRR